MFVLATELVGPEKRALEGTMVWFYYKAALMILGRKAVEPSAHTYVCRFTMHELK